MAQMATSGDRRESLGDIARRVLTTQGVHPSHMTVGRQPLEVGLEKRAPKPKPLITSPHQQLHLAFAQRHTDGDWRHAIFHGQKKFAQRRATTAVWRLRGEAVVVP